ncbi:MAG: DUF2079 domain-containing protein [bacterium]|nr:DUF2079 domain-containing protein [bacterium]
MQRRTAYILLAILGVLTTAWVLTIAAAKLNAGAANALDLGIYTQVAWNTAHGHLFAFTIHPHLYLGDHVEFLYALAAIPFRILPSPLTLVALQCFAVVGAAFALFGFARRSLSTLAAFGFSTLFLLNPFTLNALTFEFHAVLFGLPFAFLAASAYHDKRLGYFWLWASLMLFAREDLALLLVGFTLLALFEKQSRNWWLWPGLIAIFWFISAGILAGAINGEGYKFLSFLQPNGAHVGSLGSGILATFNPANLLVMVALLLPVLGLPFYAWRWLTLLALPLLGIGLAGFGSGDLVLQTHYAAFFLPGLFCGTVLGWKRFWEKPPLWVLALKEHGRPLITLTLIIVSVYSLLTFGPTISAIRAWRQVTPAEQKKAKVAAELAYYNPDAATLAGYSTLVNFSTRARVYAAHYAFLGKRQFSDRDYPVPSDLSLAVLDAQDFVLYQIQYAAKETRKTEYTTGAERFRQILTDRGLHLSNVSDTLLTFSHTGADLLPALVTREQRQSLSGVEFAFNTATTPLDVTTDGQVTLALEGQIGNPSLANVQARLSWLDAENHVVETRLLPLGYGLWPTSSWQADELVTTRFTLAVPTDATHGTVQALIPKGYLALNGWRSAVPVIDKDAQTFGEPLNLTLQH